MKNKSFIKLSLLLFLVIWNTHAWADGKTIYAVGGMNDNGSSWHGNIGTLYCHNWGSDGTVWPGTLMSELDGVTAGGNKIFYCNLKSDDNTTIIFDGGNDTWQTSNIAWGSPQNAYPQPTYANGSWWYSPRMASAIWSSVLDNVTGGYVYFDNTNAQWNETYMYVVVGHDTYLGYYQLTKLNGTKLYYCELPSMNWTDAKYVAVVGHNATKSTGGGSANDLAGLRKFSDANHYRFISGTSYMITMSSGDNCTPTSIDWQTTGYTAYNNRQTIYKSLNNTSSSANVGTVTVTTTKLTNNCAGTKDNSTATIGSSASSAYTDAVKTATVKLTASEAAGYEFLGWASSANGSIISDDSPYEYTATSTNTYYAKFRYRTYSITYKDEGGSAFSGVHGDGYPTSHTYNTATALVNPTKDGYSFAGWYIDEDCTVSAGSELGATAYTSNITLYAKWSLSPGVSLAAAKTSGINVGETVRLTATGSNASNITQYAFYEGETLKYTATTSAGSATYDYTPSVAGAKTMKVIMTYNSGSNTVTSNNVALTLNTPSVATLTEASSTEEMWIGIDASDALTFSATSNNVGSGASVTWSISDASSGTFTQTGAGSYSGKSWTYVPASTGSKTITVTMTVGGNNYTKTYSLEVYERWNIYVQNNCGWDNGIALYFYGNETPASWPGVQGTGTGCEQYSAKWWKVTLDSYYTKFILDNNVNGGSGEEKLVDNVAVNKATYPADSYYDFAWSSGTGPKYYTLNSISLSVPTVSITSYEVISSTQIKLTGTISNYGSDGSTAASDLKEVGFYCGETKHSTTHTDGSTFTKVITGLSARTAYSFKAYAVNVKGEGKSSAQAVTTRAGGTYTIKVRTAVGATAPKIYAWTDADANDGVKEENATYGSGAAMTDAITGTVYKWWSYELNKTYNNFLIYETGDGNKTNNITAPQTATCYWYNSSNAIASRYGTMDCPHATPQLYIERTAGSGTYDYYEMTNTSGTLSKSLSLTAKSTYKFKIFYNGEYFGKNATATRASNTIDDLSASTDTYAQITTDAAGSYSFSFTTAGKDFTAGYPVAYTITYGIGAINGSSTAIGATSTPSFTSGDYVLKATAVTFTKGTTKDGYTWEGWYSSNDGTGTCYSSTDGSWTSSANTRTDDIEVYACYSLNTYTITYNLDGGSNHKDNPANFNVETSTITLQAPTKTGYTFNGWKAKSDLSGDNVTSIPLGTYRDTTIYAKWTANNYTITLKPNGGSGDDQSVTATFDATAPDYDADEKNYKFADITNPTKTGYNFEGWWTSSDAGTTLVTEIITKYKFYEWNTSYVNNSGLWKNDGDVTTYAKWTPATYTVTLDCEETGKGSDGENSSVTATYNAAMPSMGDAPVGAPGYKFMGYFTEAGGGGTKYYNANGSSAKNWDIANNTTLYAHFLKSVITDLEHDASIAKGEEVTIDVNPVINVTPEGYTAICWSLLYADTDNPVEGAKWSVAAKAEVGKPMQVRYTLTGLENGSYKIKAEYKSNASSGFDACSTGTTQNTDYSTFRIIGSNTITLRYTNDKYYDPYFLRENGSIEIPAMESVGVKAPEIAGWKFWKWDYSDGIHSECANTGVCNWDKDSINISANYDGTLTAMYQKKRVIYFNNTLNWDNVYVYFYSSGYWDNSTGSGAKTGGSYTGKYGQMTPIAPGSKIYYYDAEAASVDASYTTVVFSELNQDGYEHFAQTESVNNKVVYRTDYNSTKLPMYVPLVTEPVQKNSNLADYYNEGYWMNYPDSTGYELRIYNQKAIDGSYELSYKRQIFKFTGDKTMPMSVTVDLEKNRTYGFKIYRTDGTYWGNNNTMTNGHSGDEGQPVWEFTTGASSNAGLTTTGAGYYTFTLSYGEDLSHNFNYLVGVRYPESSGDFRVLYKDNVKTNWRPSAIIPKATDTTIVSYFVRAGSTPYIKAQICSLEEDPENPGDEHMILSWRDSIAGANLIPLCTGASDTITKYGDGVYNFLFAKVDGNLILAKVEPYTGNFYIRVDGAGYSNWDKYIADDHLMPYSDYSFNQTTDKYSHYYTHYYDAPDDPDATWPNVKFVVANEYSPYISDTITQDGIANNYVNENGYICRDANIRFMYNYKTNEATRRYIDGAQEVNSTFLVLTPSNNTSIYDAETEGNAITNLTFSDDGNWIYEANVWVVPGTQYKLKAKYGAPSTSAFNENGEVISFLKGKETGDGEYETLIGGSGGAREHIRLLYDFKTNRLVAAWLPSGNIETNEVINADVMFIREGQEDVTQVTFGESGAISAIQNVYSVMRFNKWTLNNRDKSSHSLLGDPLSPYERALYWISFPYDVKLSDVFGFGTYGTHWIIEYYDGAYRAANGFWADSEANWKFVMPDQRNSFVLKAGLGYILALDLDKLWCSGEGVGEQDDIWKNIQTGEIIFPGDIASIGNTSVIYNIPAHNCNITRNERNIKDSHWNVIGVPTYLNTSDVTYVDATEKQSWMIDGKPKYIYTWNPQDNSITSVSAAGLTYHSMTAYMVQYYGDITFTTSTVSLAAAPQRYENAPQDVEFRLEIQQNEETVDQTFVRMSIDEDVTAGFEFGQDMTKEMNAGKANVYTLIAGSESNIEAAGNVLPFSTQTTVVPVGVKIKTAGEYTFAIPEGTYGVGIVLIDNIAGTRTNLGLMDYVVTLDQGQIDNRFLLEISPIQQTPTDVEAVTGDGLQVTGARKVMIDGLLYIVKDGKVYDAQGKRVQ